MEKLHKEALAAKEEEMSARINKAVVCAKDFLSKLDEKRTLIEY